MSVINPGSVVDPDSGEEEYKGFIIRRSGGWPRHNVSHSGEERNVNFFRKRDAILWIDSLDMLPGPQRFWPGANVLDRPIGAPLPSETSSRARKPAPSETIPRP